MAACYERGTLLDEIKSLIKKYEDTPKEEKLFTYSDFIDLTQEIFSSTLPYKSVMLVLPLEWKKTMEIYPKPDGILSYYAEAVAKKQYKYSVLGRPSISEPFNKVFFDVKTPYGDIDMLVFADVEQPRIYTR